MTAHSRCQRLRSEALLLSFSRARKPCTATGTAESGMGSDRNPRACLPANTGAWHNSFMPARRDSAHDDQSQTSAGSVVPVSALVMHNIFRFRSPFYISCSLPDIAVFPARNAKKAARQGGLCLFSPAAPGVSPSGTAVKLKYSVRPCCRPAFRTDFPDNVP